jgi:hypothetical protein
MVKPFADAVQSLKKGEYHPDAGAVTVRLARDPAARYARYTGAAAGSGQGPGRTDWWSTKKFRAYQDESDEDRQGREEPDGTAGPEDRRPEAGGEPGKATTP